jgi:hypothetical protein
MICKEIVEPWELSPQPPESASGVNPVRKFPSLHSGMGLLGLGRSGAQHRLLARLGSDQPEAMERVADSAFSCPRSGTRPALCQSFSR